MGKENTVNRSSFMQDNEELIDHLHRQRDKLMRLPHNELTVLWFSQEHQSIDDYGLHWNSGIDDGGWACISNSTNRASFQMWADYNDYISAGFRKEYWEMIAVILANQEGITLIQTLPLSDQLNITI